MDAAHVVSKALIVGAPELFQVASPPSMEYP